MHIPANFDFDLEVYYFLQKKKGLTEISGSRDTREIEIAHRLSGVEGDSGGSNTDEIPWCASEMSLAEVCINLRLNPLKTILTYLVPRKIKEVMIKEIFAIASVDYSLRNTDTGYDIFPIIIDATALDHKAYGVVIPFSQARRGDKVMFSRKGGGHVARLDDEKLITGKDPKVLGANQSNKIGVNTYEYDNIVAVRRQAFSTLGSTAPSVPSTPAQPKPVEPKPATPVKKLNWFEKLLKAIFG